MSEDVGGFMAVHYSCSVCMTRFIDDIFVPSRFRIKAEMTFNEEAEDEAIHENLERLDYWVDGVLNGCIAMSLANDSAATLFFKKDSPFVSNPLMFAPGEPTDDLITMLLESKMSAIGNGVFTVQSVSLASEEVGGLSFTWEGSAAAELPDMSEWVGTHNWFKQPWWARNDLSMTDQPVAPDQPITDMPEWCMTFEELKNAHRPSRPNTKTGFKPRIHDGGKRD